jgi:hypothetical protein
LKNIAENPDFKNCLSYITRFLKNGILPVFLILLGRVGACPPVAGLTLLGEKKEDYRVFLERGEGWE